MRTDFYLKTLSEIQGEAEARLTDSGNTLATDAQYVAAINEGIRMWGRRVTSPRYYAISGGLISGTYEYTLPSYISPPLILEIRSTAFNQYGAQVSSGSDGFTWHQLAGYTLRPNSTGGWTLRLPSTPYSEDAQITWWAENGPLLTTAPTVTTTISSTATSVLITTSSSPEIGESGFIKIDVEWMSYAGVTRTSASSYTLNNLTRALFGTIAASHTSTTAISLGVAVDDQRLWTQLLDYVTGYVHALQLHKATTEDTSRHEKLMSFYNQKAENFWRDSGYLGQRRGSLQMTPRALGSTSW
jgi:hypothetical protein